MHAAALRSESCSNDACRGGVARGPPRRARPRRRRGTRSSCAAPVRNLVRRARARDFRAASLLQRRRFEARIARSVASACFHRPQADFAAANTISPSRRRRSAPASVDAARRLPCMRGRWMRTRPARQRVPGPHRARRCQMPPPRFAIAGSNCSISATQFIPGRASRQRPCRSRAGDACAAEFRSVYFYAGGCRTPRRSLVSRCAQFTQHATTCTVATVVRHLSDILRAHRSHGDARPRLIPSSTPRAPMKAPARRKASCRRPVRQPARPCRPCRRLVLAK